MHPEAARRPCSGAAANRSHRHRTGSAGRPAPFARRSARIARWLLLHRGAEPTIDDLAAATGLSRPFTSQIAAALADEALTSVTIDSTDARRRRVAVRVPGALLDRLAAEWRRRRISPAPGT